MNRPGHALAACLVWCAAALLSATALRAGGVDLRLRGAGAGGPGVGQASATGGAALDQAAGAGGAALDQAAGAGGRQESGDSVLRRADAADSAFRPDDLVEVTSVDSTIRLDIRYATPHNFMGRPMYTEARAFLQRPAAEALARANRRLREAGYVIVIFDGYRPWSITKKFWDETPASKHSFVADPKLGSKHNRGCAVDCSLFDLRAGKEAVMPSPYDDFTEKASPRYRGGTRAERSRRDLLRRTMEREHFTVDPGEWWHFDYRDWRKYRILDVPFGKIR